MFVFRFSLLSFVFASSSLAASTLDGRGRSVDARDARARSRVRERAETTAAVRSRFSARTRVADAFEEDGW
jgi:hypothetical protein